MVDEVPVRRREFLAAGGLAIGITAGCTEQNSDSPSEEFQVGYGGVPARHDLESSEQSEGNGGASDGRDGSNGGSGNGDGGSSSTVYLPGGGSDGSSSGSSGEDSGSAYGGIGFGEGPYGGVPADTASDGNA